MPEPNSKRPYFLTGACTLLAIALVGLTWYVYPMLRNHDASLRNLPSVTQRLNQSVDSIGNRLKEAESKAADSLSSQRSLRAQVGDLGRNLRERIEAVSKQASQSAEDTYNKLQAKVETEVQAQTEKLANVNERVSGLESSREADQMQIAQLKQELSQAREQADARNVQQSTDLAQVRNEMEQNHSGEIQQLAGLKRDQDRDRHNISAVSDQIAVRKVPFEVTKNHSGDLGDGISLYIDNTNTMYRQASGWMWVANDRRNIWLRNQSVQQPVIFYGNSDGQKRELVITNVNKNSITGYLLLPKQTTAAFSRPTNATTGATAQ